MADNSSNILDVPVAFSPGLFYTTTVVDLTSVNKSVTHAVLQARHSSQGLLDSGFVVHIMNDVIPLNLTVEGPAEDMSVIVASSVIEETVMSSQLSSSTISLLSSASIMTSSIMPSLYDDNTSTLSDFSTIQLLPTTSSILSSTYIDSLLHSSVVTMATRLSQSYFTVHVTSSSSVQESLTNILKQSPVSLPTSPFIQTSLIDILKESTVSLQPSPSPLSSYMSSLSILVTEAAAPISASTSSSLYQISMLVSSYSEPQGTNLLTSLSHVQYDTSSSTYEMPIMTFICSESRSTDSLSSFSDTSLHLTTSPHASMLTVRPHPSEMNTKSIIRQTGQSVEVTTFLSRVEASPSNQTQASGSLPYLILILICVFASVCSLLLIGIVFILVVVAIKRYKNRTGSYSPARCESVTNRVCVSVDYHYGNI